MFCNQFCEAYHYITRYILRSSQVAHQAGAYFGFWWSMKRLGVFLLRLDGMPALCRVNPSIKFAGGRLYTCVERGTMRVKGLAKEHNLVSRPGLVPEPPYPESSALTIRPLRLQHILRPNPSLFIFLVSNN